MNSNLVEEREVLFLGNREKAEITRKATLRHVLVLSFSVDGNANNNLTKTRGVGYTSHWAR
jgi:hypothetical protein